MKHSNGSSFGDTRSRVSSPFLPDAMVGYRTYRDLRVLFAPMVQLTAFYRRRMSSRTLCLQGVSATDRTPVGQRDWRKKFFRQTVSHSCIHNFQTQIHPHIHRKSLGLTRKRNILAFGIGRDQNRFQFIPDDYVQVSLRRVDLGAGDSMASLIFQRDTAVDQGKVDERDEQDRALVVVVGGDTLLALLALLQGQLNKRPLSIDLLWNILEHLEASSQSKQNRWKVLRVAVVGTSSNAYIGRIFFGYKDENGIEQDCFDSDIRPSDATWLALKSNAPVYVAKDVWETCTTNLGPMTQPEASYNEGHSGMSGTSPSFGEEHWAYGYSHPAEVEESKEEVSSNVLATMTRIRPHDPEPLKRLKMELKLALRDENFEAAARIRDHPFMLLHIAAQAAKKDGDVATARRFEDRLHGEILRLDQQSLQMGSGDEAYNKEDDEVS